MNHLRWAAWDVIKLDGGAFDRQQRRVYLDKVRKELEVHRLILQPGGSTKTPHYVVTSYDVQRGKPICHTTGGTDAFKRICAWILEHTGELHVGSEDGGVRGAGDEAQEPGVRVAV